MRHIAAMEADRRAELFQAHDFVPVLNRELEKDLGEGQWCFMDEQDELVVNFYYPQIFETDYLCSCVRLEIGPLAEWVPSHETEIMPFAAERYPALFEKRSTRVLTVDAERTFWERIRRNLCQLTEVLLQKRRIVFLEKGSL